MKRSESDDSYLASLFQNSPVDTDGVFPLNEDVLCTYIDLDNLIDSAGLSDTERRIVDYLMQGYGISDIADVLGHARQTASILFDRAVEKIIARNNQVWDECYGSRSAAEFMRRR